MVAERNVYVNYGCQISSHPMWRRRHKHIIIEHVDMSSVKRSEYNLRGWKSKGSNAMVIHVG